MRARGENLYVVMEVVETVKEVTLERAGKAEGVFSLPFFAPLGLQVWLKHTHTHTHTQIQPFLRGYINFVSSVPTQDTIKDPPLLPTLPDPAPH